MPYAPGHRHLFVLAIGAVLGPPAHAGEASQYTATGLGSPPGASIVGGVRMNNLGHVAGYSVHYGQGDPLIRPWVWTPEDGITMLPTAPTHLGRARAMDINDNGVVVGDGGFDSGLAWRYENGEYEIFGDASGMPIAYLGGVNEAGDVAGTSKDSTIVTPDIPFLSMNDGAEINLLPPNGGGRATDINNNGQVCGYHNGGGFEAFLWDPATGIEFLGTLDLAYSYGLEMNDAGQVVGYAKSANGNTIAPWIHTPGVGQQEIPILAFPSAINNHGVVVGTQTCCGADKAFMWTEQDGVVMLSTLFDFAAAGFTSNEARDINDAGQILLQVYDNSIPGFRPVLLTPIDTVDACPCDMNDDGHVDVDDLLQVIIMWNTNDPTADVTQDGAVTVDDLVLVITHWGACP